MRFLLGLILGVALACGGYFGYKRWKFPDDDCFGRCGVGTECALGVCVIDKPARPATRRPRRRRRRRQRRRARRTRRRAASDSGTLRRPSAAEKRAVARGPALGSTDYIAAGDAASGRRLTTAEITRRFRKLDRRIVACIDSARGGVDLEGEKIVVGFRIERSGRVRKVRVTAPAIVQRAGIYRCIRRLVVGLRFPSTPRSVIMSFPYRL